MGDAVMDVQGYKTIDIPPKILNDWQELLNHIALEASIPAALIMRVSDTDISVCVSSDTEGNPYKVGDSESLKGELYCETVIANQQELLVPNALKDVDWNTNPDIELGMISYCGLPVNWPTGEAFGTICILDNKENHYSDKQRALLGLFRKMVESNLDVCYQNQTLESKILQRTTQLEYVNKKLAQTIDQYAAEKEISNLQKYRDSFTWLPNLSQLEKFFNDHLKQSEPKLSVISLRINNYAQLREELGLIDSQKVTIYVSKQLTFILPSTVYLASVSDEEICILFLCDNQGYVEETIEIAEKLSQKLNKEVSIQDKKVALSVSLGVSIYPQDSEDFMPLVRKANSASIQCYTDNKSYQFFNKKMTSDLSQKHQIEVQLSSALRNNELSLYYQPLVDVKTDKVMGAEVLLRWYSPMFSLLLPESFLAVAEDSKQIIEIGYYSLRESIQQLAKWQMLYGEEFYLSINLSPVQLLDESLLSKIKYLLELYEVDASSIEIEFQESILCQNEEQLLQTLSNIQALGINISLDNFGSESSSLKYLHTLPISTLKVERKLISGLFSPQSTNKITSAIISMAKNLDIKVVAKGIETAEQAEFIKECGGNLYQGYYFGKPVNANDFFANYLSASDKH